MARTKAIIVDLDGTLYDSSGRKHYVEGEDPNYEKFYKAAKFDRPHKWCAEVVRKFYKEYDILYVSGRPETYYYEARDWMRKHGVPYPGQKGVRLFMRKVNDFRKDTEIKKEIYDSQIRNYFEVLFALDDRPSVCRMWREQGITVLQCQEEEF